MKYTNAVYDEDTETWVFVAELAANPLAAFTSRKKDERVPVRRMP